MCNEKYKHTLANLLGWDNICDCGKYAPFLHTHGDREKFIAWKDNCTCGGLYMFDHALWERSLGHSYDIEAKTYICNICNNNFTVYRKLDFKITDMLGERMSEDKKEDYQIIISNLEIWSTPHNKHTGWHLAIKEGDFSGNTSFFMATGNLIKDLELLKEGIQKLIDYYHLSSKRSAN